ncbi:hypothetical protein GCM10023322_79180 [Rugosimonospora acidiphila]|uniref:Uncharacterized protein n=1 Tax=Rugosimonospora acidiphila TaxID=556531 RepID=A0ABP9SQB2_9ACTN
MAKPATTGTPLTRYGNRAVRLLPRPVTPTATATRPAAVTPAATIRTMIVCLPDELPRDTLTAHQLDRHFGVTGTLFAGFWATPALHRWQRTHLIGPRQGRPTCCAGGPVKLLDLAGMRHAAGLGAGIRYQQWTHVVHGTRPATPWPVFHARHLADPSRYPMDTAQADYHNQPRVNAIRMHNAVTYGAQQLDLAELEMFQAGLVAYQHYRAVDVLVRDAVLTAQGATLAPDSDAFTHRVTYLEQAHRYLDSLEPTQRLLTITL